MLDTDHFKAVNDTHGRPVGEGISPRWCGVSAPEHRNESAFLQLADKALCRAKESGRNRAEIG